MFFLLLVIIFGFLLKFTSFGRYAYAIGGNEQVARVAGIRVDAVKITVYALQEPSPLSRGSCRGFLQNSRNGNLHNAYAKEP